MKPSQILENLARLKGISPPQIAEDGSSLSFGGRDYSLQDLGIPGVITTECIERKICSFIGDLCVVLRITVSVWHCIARGQ